MFDNNISIDTTYNTLYTGYDTLNRVLNTAESLEQFLDRNPLQ